MAAPDQPGNRLSRNAIPVYDSYQRVVATPIWQAEFIESFFSVFSQDERHHWNRVFNGQVSLYKPK